MAGGSNASPSPSASTTAKGKKKENPIGAGGADHSVVGEIPSASGPFTSVPLDLPTAHSPMDVDHEAESLSLAPPIPTQRPPHIGRSRNNHESDGDDEKPPYDLFFELFQVHWSPELEMRMRRTGDEVRASISASASTTVKSESKEKPTDASGAGDSVVDGIPPASGPFTSAPLDPPIAHLPMDIDHEAESVSVAPSIPMQRPPHIGRSRSESSDDGSDSGDDVDDEEGNSDLFFELFQVHWTPELAMRMRGTGDELHASASASASITAKGESKEKPTEA